MIVDCKNCRAAGHTRCQCPNDGVLKDGQTIRVGVMMTDSAAGALAIRDYAEQRGVTDAQAGYEMRIGDAWKSKAHMPAADDPQPRLSSAAPIATADNGQAAYEARLQAAWRGQDA